MAWMKPVAKSWTKPQTFTPSLSAAATRLLFSALLGWRLRCNAELYTWTDPFSEDLTPNRPTQCKSASTCFPLHARVGSGEEAEQGQHRENGKDVLTPGIKGLTELLRVQVDPVNSFKSPAEIQTELRDLTGAEEGSRGRVLLGLPCA